MLNRFEEKVKKIEEFVNALNNFDKTLKDIGTIFVFHSSEKMLHNLPYFLDSNRNENGKKTSYSQNVKCFSESAFHQTQTSHF